MTIALFPGEPGADSMTPIQRADIGERAGTSPKPAGTRGVFACLARK
jgi:hypothetical protein